MNGEVKTMPDLASFLATECCPRHLLGKMQIYLPMPTHACRAGCPCSGTIDMATRSPWTGWCSAIVIAPPPAYCSTCIGTCSLTASAHAQVLVYVPHHFSTTLHMHVLCVYYVFITYVRAECLGGSSMYGEPVLGGGGPAGSLAHITS
jgi:hypothetical protein